MAVRKLSERKKLSERNLFAFLVEQIFAPEHLWLFVSVSEREGARETIRQQMRYRYKVR